MEYMIICVAPGETAATVSRKYKTTERSLFSLNKNADFHAGERLLIAIQSGMRYVVQPFDTAATIAAKFNVSPERVIKANGTDKFFLGQSVIIP